MPVVASYHRAIVLLHWLMALCFLMMLTSGYVMTTEGLLDKALRFQMFQWHKSLGILLLMAAALRVAIRAVTRAPALPAVFKSWENFAAKAGHVALYVIMFLMPFSGWTMVSSSPYGLPTIVFGLFEWPHLPGLEGNQVVSDKAHALHYALAIVFIALIAGHVGAVLKHWIFDRINLLPRMYWRKST